MISLYLNKKFWVKLHFIKKCIFNYDLFPKSIRLQIFFISILRYSFKKEIGINIFSLNFRISIDSVFRKSL